MASEVIRQDRIDTVCEHAWNYFFQTLSLEPGVGPEQAGRVAQYLGGVYLLIVFTT